MLAAVLRFSTVGLQSYWSDEAVTVALVRMDFRDMLGLIPESESTPPLYYAVAWLWAWTFGSDEIALRSLSALVGTAAAPLTAAAARVLVSRRTAVVAAALVAVNPLLIWYSQEARAYSMLVALVAASLLAFARAREAPTGPRLAGWASTAVLAGTTHYFAAFVIVPQAVFLLATRRRVAVGAVGAVTLGALALLPLALAQRGTGSAEWIARSAFDARLATSAKQLLVGRSGPFDRPLAALAAIAIATSVVLLVRSSDKRARRGAAVAAGIGLVALALPVALTAVRLDYVIAQNVLAALVPLIVAVATGFAVGTPRPVALAALVSLCVISLALVAAVAVDPSYQRADWRGAARATAPREGTRLIVLDNDFGGWFARLPFRLYLPAARAVDDGLEALPRRFPERLRRRTEDYDQPSAVAANELVFVSSGRSACDVRRTRALRAFELVDEVDVDGLRVVTYRAPRRERVAPRDLAACMRDREVAILVHRR